MPGELPPVADGRAAARREALPGQLLLGPEHVGGRGGRIELVDRHEDVRDQRPKWAFWHRLLVGEDVDAALAQECAVDQALLHVPGEATELPDEHPREARPALSRTRDDRLETLPPLEVRPADAGVLDDIAGCPSALDGCRELSDLAGDRQLVAGLVFGRDSDVDDAVGAGRDLYHCHSP